MARLRNALGMGRASVEYGQSLVIFAGGLAVLLGLVGLSIDIGLLMQRNAALQRAADAAALAGALDLASSTPNVTSADAAARSYIMKNEASLDAGVGATSVTFAGTYRANDTIAVTLEEPVEFAFLKFIGVDSGQASASARVVTQAATGMRVDEVDVFPYAVWGGPRIPSQTNNCPYNICMGSTQVYRSNHWDSDSYTTGSAYDVHGNNFKGYFHAGGEVVQVDSDSWQTFSKGGNAQGQQPLEALDEHIASGEPVVLPVIAAASCRGGCGTIDFKIVAWVALKLDRRGSTSQPWTGKVVAWSSPAASTGGGEQPPAGFPSVYGFSLID